MQNKRKILGIAGFANSGKDTLADQIIRNKSYFQKIAFAKPIKDMMIEHFGFSKQQCYDQNLKQQKDDFWGLSPRDVMLLVGTKLFRQNWRYDFWVKLMQKRFIDNPNTNFIVSDVRFDNQAEMIKDYGGKIIVVHRQNNPIKVQHISEKGIYYNLVDMTILNNSTLSDYLNKIDVNLENIISNDDNQKNYGQI